MIKPKPTPKDKAKFRLKTEPKPDAQATTPKRCDPSWGCGPRDKAEAIKPGDKDDRMR